MLSTKIQSQSFLSSGEEVSSVVYHIWGMAAILFNGAEPFEQIVNVLWTEGPMWNLVKIVQVILEMTFKIPWFYIFT